MRGQPFWAVQLGCVADIDRLLVVLVHVVNEGEVVVGVRVLAIELGADLEVLYCKAILLFLEIRQAQIVLKLGVVGLEFAGFLERQARLVIEFHLVERYT